MVKQRRREVALGALLAALLAVYWFTRGSDPVAPAPGTAAGSRPGGGANAGAAELPTIDLDRLQRRRTASAEAGSRNIFEYAQPPAPPPPVVQEAPPPPPAPVAPPPSEAELAAARAAAGPPPPPPLSVKYIGSLESKQGLKVAILMTDRKEILTGQAGETIANRLRIVSIGLESVDVQDVGSDRVRRIPLKGN